MGRMKAARRKEESASVESRKADVKPPYTAPYSKCHSPRGCDHRTFEIGLHFLFNFLC
jgi:hypothetical protein